MLQQTMNLKKGEERGKVIDFITRVETVYDSRQFTKDMTVRLLDLFQTDAKLLGFLYEESPSHF